MDPRGLSSVEGHADEEVLLTGRPAGGLRESSYCSWHLPAARLPGLSERVGRGLTPSSPCLRHLWGCTRMVRDGHASSSVRQSPCGHMSGPRSVANPLLAPRITVFKSDFRTGIFMYCINYNLFTGLAW